MDASTGQVAPFYSQRAIKSPIRSSWRCWPCSQQLSSIPPTAKWSYCDQPGPTVRRLTLHSSKSDWNHIRRCILSTASQSAASACDKCGCQRLQAGSLSDKSVRPAVDIRTTKTLKLAAFRSSEAATGTYQHFTDIAELPCPISICFICTWRTESIPDRTNLSDRTYKPARSSSLSFYTQSRWNILAARCSTSLAEAGYRPQLLQVYWNATTAQRRSAGCLGETAYRRRLFPGQTEISQTSQSTSRTAGILRANGTTRILFHFSDNHDAAFLSRCRSKDIRCSAKLRY